jgi:hypothetical protein
VAGDGRAAHDPGLVDVRLSGEAALYLGSTPTIDSLSSGESRGPGLVR